MQLLEGKITQEWSSNVSKWYYSSKVAYILRGELITDIISGWSKQEVYSKTIGLRVALESEELFDIDVKIENSQ